jgi:hypothetical protein
VGSLYAATTEAAESLIAQLRSQSKLLQLSRGAKIEKFYKKSKFKKQMNTRRKGVATSDLLYDT